MLSCAMFLAPTPNIATLSSRASCSMRSLTASWPTIAAFPNGVAMPTILAPIAIAFAICSPSRMPPLAKSVISNF